MNLPEFNPRRPLDDDNPDGYMESDNDFMGNNADLVLALLELYQEGRITIQPAPEPPSCRVCGTTEGLFRDHGFNGPYRCGSADCIPF